MSIEKLTPEKIKARIKKVTYFPVEDTTTTICAIELDNSFVAVGKSACMSKDYFDAEIGRKVAYDDAFDKLWEPMGFSIIENNKE